MNRRYLTVLIGALGLTGLLLGGTAGLTQESESEDTGIFDQVSLVKSDEGGEPAPKDEGVEPEARGPIHEAFASASVSNPEPGPVIETEPPEPIEEMPPEEKPEGDNVQWIPGYFDWDEEATKHMWITGIWRTPPPGREWMAGYWGKVAKGWQRIAGFWKPVDGGDIEVVPAPPEPVVESPGEPPNDNSFYTPGCWVHRGTRFVWRSGCWVDYRPDWVWVNACYLHTPCGYVFVDGYWDYVLRDRGLLFCPVYVDSTYAYRPGWYYRPRYVIHDYCLLGSLFVRPRCGCYYFGDYFGARYTGLGYVSWVDYRVGRRH